jgi:hypothetical protein
LAVDCGALPANSSIVMLPLLVSISTRGLAGWPSPGWVETVCAAGGCWALQPVVASRVPSIMEKSRLEKAGLKNASWIGSGGWEGARF